MKRLNYLFVLLSLSFFGTIASMGAQQLGGASPSDTVVSLICLIVWVAMWLGSIRATHYRCADIGYTSKWATVFYYLVPLGVFALMLIPTGARTRQLERRANAADLSDLGAAYRR
jgi:hypothetical protein